MHDIAGATQWGPRNRYRGSRRAWLAASGSLSARLAQAGRAFEVQLLRCGRLPAQGHEAQALGWSGPRAAYVREVVLRVDGLPVVFARSLTAYPDSLGAWRSLRGLGSRPLADVLFLRQGIARSPLQFTSIKPAAALRRQIARQWMAATGQSLLPRSLPARRSVFRHAGAPLLVMEVFAALPAPWNWPIE